MAVKKPADNEIPKTLALVVDKLWSIRKERLALDKQVTALKAEETTLREYLIEKLPEHDASGISGKLARVALVPKEAPRVVDWESFYKYVAKTKQFDLLQRRLSEASICERLDDGKVIPGVELYKYNSLSVGTVK